MKLAALILALPMLASAGVNPGGSRYNRLCNYIPACVADREAEAEYRKNYWKNWQIANNKRIAEEDAERAKRKPPPKRESNVNLLSLSHENNHRDTCTGGSRC
jgi:hypothetical protein